MEYTELFLKTFMLLVILTLTSNAASRVKRQGMTFMVIKNTSMPCEELQSQQGPEVRRVELTDAQKLQLFTAGGGQYMKKYQAITKEEAVENFPSLVGVDPEILNKVLKKSQLSNPAITSVTKEQIRNYMINDVYSNWDRDGVSGVKNGRTLKSREFMDTISNVHDIPRRAALWQKWAKDSGSEIEHFPMLFPEMLGIQRVHTREDGSVVEQDGCFVRGTETVNPMYLRMCTVCMATTTLEPNKWPPYINEASCDTMDNGCLIVDSVTHGLCQQITMTVDILTQTINQCTLALADGETVVAEGWTMGKMEVNVGCECTINENSYFASFL